MSSHSGGTENYVRLINYKTKQPIVSIRQPGRFTIGRKNSTKSSDIGLPSHDNYFSGQHFILEISRGWQVRLKDNQSLNGTYILDKETEDFIRLNFGEEVFLRNGDVFRAGRTEFQVELPNNKRAEAKAIKVEQKKATVVQMN